MLFVPLVKRSWFHAHYRHIFSLLVIVVFNLFQEVDQTFWIYWLKVFFNFQFLNHLIIYLSLVFEEIIGGVEAAQFISVLDPVFGRSFKNYIDLIKGSRHLDHQIPHFPVGI